MRVPTVFRQPLNQTSSRGGAVFVPLCRSLVSDPYRLREEHLRRVLSLFDLRPAACEVLNIFQLSGHSSLLQAFASDETLRTRSGVFVLLRLPPLGVAAAVDAVQQLLAEAILGWHCLSNATCLLQPRSFSTALLV